MGLFGCSGTSGRTLLCDGHFEKAGKWEFPTNAVPSAQHRSNKAHRSHLRGVQIHGQMSPLIPLKSLWLFHDSFPGHSGILYTILAPRTYVHAQPTHTIRESDIVVWNDEPLEWYKQVQSPLLQKAPMWRKHTGSVCRGETIEITDPRLTYDAVHQVTPLTDEGVMDDQGSD